MPVNIPETAQKRIVIIGAGFGGLKLAQKLVGSGYQIVLIDKNNYHQFQPLFYQVTSAGIEPSSILFPLRKIFQKQKDVYIRWLRFIRSIPIKRNFKPALIRFGTIIWLFLPE